MKTLNEFLAEADQIDEGWFGKKKRGRGPDDPPLPPSAITPEPVPRGWTKRPVNKYRADNAAALAAKQKRHERNWAATHGGKMDDYPGIDDEDGHDVRIADANRSQKPKKGWFRRG